MKSRSQRIIEMLTNSNHGLTTQAIAYGLDMIGYTSEAKVASTLNTLARDGRIRHNNQPIGPARVWKINSALRSTIIEGIMATKDRAFMRKQGEHTPVMQAETVEQFLARGGVIERLDAGAASYGFRYISTLDEDDE